MSRIDHLIAGLYFGFPICCVNTFVRLCQDRLPAQYMWEMYGNYRDGVNYVRCHNCNKHNIKINPKRRLEYKDSLLKIYTKEYNSHELALELIE